MRLIASQARRGAILAAASVGNYLTLGVYNDSASGMLLLVRTWDINQGGGPNQGYIAAAQATPPAVYTRGEPLVTGGNNFGGYLFQLNAAAPLTPTYVTSITNGLTYWRQPYPFAILQPGWSLQYQANATNIVFNLGIIWEMRHPEDFDDPAAFD